MKVDWDMGRGGGVPGPEGWRAPFIPVLGTDTTAFGSFAFQSVATWMVHSPNEWYIHFSTSP